VLLNAAAALVVVGHATDLEDGMHRAAASVDSGAAARSLDRLVSLSRSEAVRAEAGEGPTR
jgi:anthranilate phosphoribosyltransferase